MQMHVLSRTLFLAHTKIIPVLFLPHHLWGPGNLGVSTDTSQKDKWKVGQKLSLSCCEQFLVSLLSWPWSIHMSCCSVRLDPGDSSLCWCEQTPCIILPDYHAHVILGVAVRLNFCFSSSAFIVCSPEEDSWEKLLQGSHWDKRSWIWHGAHWSVHISKYIQMYTWTVWRLFAPLTHISYTSTNQSFRKTCARIINSCKTE